MSFILDALRKSEHARQKQTGPGFAEVPVVAAKPKTNTWATAAIALLVVNLVAVGVLLLRRANDEAPSTVSTDAPASPVASMTPPGDTAAPATSAAVNEPTLSPASPPPLASPVEPAPRPRPSTDGRNPLAEEVGEAASIDPALSAAAARVPEGPPAVTRQAAAPARRGGTVVYAPIPEAADAPYSPPPSAPREPATDNLPTADEVTARGGLPELHLDLHVYSSSPQQRFIFVNSRKYREGDALQEGPVVEKITTTGAVLAYRGARFKLSND